MRLACGSSFHQTSHDTIAKKQCLYFLIVAIRRVKLNGRVNRRDWKPNLSQDQIRLPPQLFLHFQFRLDHELWPRLVYYITKQRCIHAQLQEAGLFWHLVELTLRVGLSPEICPLGRRYFGTGTARTSYTSGFTRHCNKLIGKVSQGTGTSHAICPIGSS